MLVSTSHKFVFIHIAKNGGSSIKKVLRDYADTQTKRTRINKLKAIIPYRREPRYLVRPPHVDARWVRNRIGHDLFDSMFSFAIIRNPYDQLVSRYLYIQTYPGHHAHRASMSLDFGEFIRRQARTDYNFTKTQLSKVTDRNGKMLLTKLYRFENYSDVLPDVLARIGLPAPVKTPHEKQSTRKPYQEYYDDRSRAFVEKHFRVDLDEFGYTFDD